MSARGGSHTGCAEMRGASRRAIAVALPTAGNNASAVSVPLLACQHFAWHQRLSPRWLGLRRFSRHTRPPELYRLLDVKPSASAREIKHSFLKQARIHHPDISADADAAEVFDKIQGALTVLSDPAARREYDVSVGCVQPDYVYSGNKSDCIDWAPLAALTEADLEKEADQLDERIRSVVKSIAALGDGAVVYKTRGADLGEEMRALSERRAAVREELQKIAAARIRHGGGARARRKRQVFHAEYEYAERYSDVYKCAPARCCHCLVHASQPDLSYSAAWVPYAFLFPYFTTATAACQICRRPATRERGCTGGSLGPSATDVSKRSREREVTLCADALLNNSLDDREDD